MGQWLIPALGAFCLWGVSGFMPKLTVRYIGPRSAILFETLGGLIMAVIVLASLKWKPDIHPKGIMLAIAGGAIGFCGAMLFYQAVIRGPISLVSVFSGLYPLVTVVLALVILQEPLTLKHGLGIALGLVSMALIASP